MKKLHFIILGTMLIFMGACNKEFRKLQKSDNWEVKYDAALKYYNNKEYYKANVLLEEILPIIKGSRQSELAQFYYAYSYYYQQKYILAAHYFQTFYETYSRSEHAEEAMFMHAYALYQQSPSSNLDQQSTREAIQAIQVFMNKYPTSNYITEAQQIIDGLQYKLEVKAFDNAKLYYNLEQYEAAIISFDNFQSDYPDSKLNEEVGYYKVAAEFKLAEQSIKSKQKERYAATVKYYEDFVDKYPESKYMKEAGDFYESSLKEIKKNTDIESKAQNTNNNE